MESTVLCVAAIKRQLAVAVITSCAFYQLGLQQLPPLDHPGRRADVWVVHTCLTHIPINAHTRGPNHNYTLHRDMDYLLLFAVISARRVQRRGGRPRLFRLVVRLTRTAMLGVREGANIAALGSTLPPNAFSHRTIVFHDYGPSPHILRCFLLWPTNGQLCNPQLQCKECTMAMGGTLHVLIYIRTFWALVYNQYVV